MRRVTVSVLMPAFNASRFIRQSVASVLGQTFEDFELLVVDDGSTDDTAAILEQMRDPRLRVLPNRSNLGIVASLNRGIAAARGRYVARFDSDDICRPTRFARQVEFLDRNPGVLLVGARMNVLEHGRVRPPKPVADPDPQVLRWLFYLGNPVGHPSMMFRAGVVDQLGGYLREEFTYAEDFDFSHRVLRHGDIAVLLEPLLLYRLHETNLTRTHATLVVQRAGAVLAEAYAPLLGAQAEEAARMIAAHLLTGVPPQTRAGLVRLGAILRTVLDAYLVRHPLDEDQRIRCEEYAGRAWRLAVEAALRSGHPLSAARSWSSFISRTPARPASWRLTRSALSGLAPGKRLVARGVARLAPAPRPARSSPMLGSARLIAEQMQPEEPPALAVVVDTEAEFDWSQPFSRALTAVSAMAAQERAQDIFDAYGLRPIYVVDYAVASKPEGFAPLRGILARHGCVIGAHLHPWITPPFEEKISSHNSFAGNLSPQLEERKLRALVRVIEATFSVRPLFFKAGRYGLGPCTLATLARLGFAVDFSILPGADLRASGGPDFRFADLRPRRNGAEEVLSVPTTRGEIGLLAPLPPLWRGALQAPLARRLHLPGVLSFLHLANTVTLTPEGATAEEQIKLIRTLVAQGHRMLVLHYHSPSLVPGNTPYVRTSADLKIFLKRIETVCQFFFASLGGVPCHPADLLPEGSRERLWPAANVPA